jgi:heat shock protein HtpX
VTARGAEPWCPDCEWNLDLFEPGRHREFGFGPLDRRLFHIAYRLTAGQFAALAGARVPRRAALGPRVVTLTAAVLLLAGVVALAIFGARLVAFHFPSLAMAPGLLMVGLAVGLRPRLDRLGTHLRDADRLDRDTAPELFALIDRVSAAVGAPRPHVVLLSDDFNAYTSSVGLRRRRILSIGAPLWGALGPPERVALLGHEMGHFVNGDVRRLLLNQVAETTLNRLSYLMAPAGGHGGDGFLAAVATLIASAVQWVMSQLIFVVHLVLVGVAQRDSQRAEYLADELAASAAGTAAAVTLFDDFLIMESIRTVVCREARAGHGAADWRIAAAVARRNQAPSIPTLRQLSRRDRVSVFATHPPSGLRAAMLERRPARPAAVVLDEAASARIDDELTHGYEQARQELAHA